MFIEAVLFSEEGEPLKLLFEKNVGNCDSDSFLAGMQLRTEQSVWTPVKLQGRSASHGVTRQGLIDGSACTGCGRGLTVAETLPSRGKCRAKTKAVKHLNVKFGLL